MVYFPLPCSFPSEWVLRNHMPYNNPYFTKNYWYWTMVLPHFILRCLWALMRLNLIGGAALSCTYTYQVLTRPRSLICAFQRFEAWKKHASKLAIYRHFWRSSQTSITKELIPEEMWLRLVEWPGYLVLILVSSRFCRGSLLWKLGPTEKWKARFPCQFFFNVFSKIPENFRRFFGICTTFSNISRCSIPVGVKSSHPWHLRYGGGPALPAITTCRRATCTSGRVSRVPRWHPFEPWKKPWLVGLYRGLYYPVMWGL